MSALSSTARAQWTVTNLTPPSSSGSFVNSGFDTRQAGYTITGGQYHASLWNSSVSLFTDLNPPGATLSEAAGVSDTQQVGHAFINGQYRAGLWTGAAASWVDLTPPGATEAHATGVGSGQQVGYVLSGGRYRAGLWGGTPSSWIDLSPAGSLESYALGVGGGQQVGYAWIGDRYRAGVWTGSAPTWVDLSPPGAIDSAALAAAGGQQVGYAHVDGMNRASLWSGSAASWVDLSPTNSTHSIARGVFGGQQAGAATVSGVSHAGVWAGTAFSWVDLHPTLSAEYSSSEARAIWSNDTTTYVSGFGYNSATRRTEALLWTRPSPATCRAVWTGITGPGPGPRLAQAMVFDTARSNLVLFGGGSSGLGAADPDDVSSDTWTLNGSAWTLAATVGPSPRDLPAMVYDSVRQRVVLFGGRTNSVSAGTQTFHNDTWEWDGAAWTQRPTANAPPARFRAAASFDSSRAVMVLHGGELTPAAGPPIIFSDLWEYDGVDWTQRTIPGPTPGPRVGAPMTFDAARNVSVLWGGLTDTQQFTDTWEYNGAAWTQRATFLAGLSGSQGVIAYDSQRQRALLSDGDPASIWSWNGVAWTSLTPAPGPAARAFPAFAYDPARDALVLQGGVNPTAGTLADTAALPCPSAPWSIATQPAPRTACPLGSAGFSVALAGNNPGPFSFQWQLETAPDAWTTLGNDPLPLACGGSARIQSSSPNAPSVTISIRGCPGPALASQAFQIRCVASTPCCSTPSLRAQYSICPADFECNGSLAVSDVFAFLNAWFDGNLAADVDGTSGLQVSDIFAFLNAWFGGC
ncbi:MAG TPA: GC-type dockerin domain-anchored protein [Phycisphaerales bacterium]|nr:GC-type dockerin domain-anchored protein [Phycisphaerales bacterium]